jgi:hypothetical protein
VLTSVCLLSLSLSQIYFGEKIPQMFLDWSPGDSHMFLPQHQQKQPPVKMASTMSTSKSPSRSSSVEPTPTAI